MFIYSFRSECPPDILEFQKVCHKTNIMILIRFLSYNEPELGVEFESPHKIEELMEAISSIVDGHVMLQTLRKCSLAKNSLKRNFDLE